jgi:hypothetical protein
MSRQLNLFPDKSVDSIGISQKDLYSDEEIEFNAVDEIFAKNARFRDSREYMNLLGFIARFPTYSAFNGFLMYIQNPSATHVATARSWARKFNRRPKTDARPLIILAPMAPVRFVFDIKDTEGTAVPDNLLEPLAIKTEHLIKMYANVMANCLIQGIAVYETHLDRDLRDTATRMTPALRKKYKELNLKIHANYLITVNQELSLEAKYASLAYELGHVFCGHLGIDGSAWWLERHGLNPGGEELEAASAAYLVSRRAGLTSGTEKFLSDYPDGNQAIPVISLNAVLQAVTYIEGMGKSRWTRPKKRSRY